MRRSQESPSDILLKLPWWVSAVLGLVAFAAIRWGLPAWAGQSKFLQPLAEGLAPFALVSLVLFGTFAVASFAFSHHQRRLIDNQTSLESLRNTSWKQFEYLVAEAFRRQGYFYIG